ncbi:uncharacterized protein LOC123532008 [Mercenaria mercenaria]|uniref:uncharacterized protein LOC123532008 n=1 Tax=Mercenaria mercenaria TaxID=6596 RepID=UPI00234F0CD3|nr:uncharacterized protein LOC123532008 [Mercenaria mercenaria]
MRRIKENKREIRLMYETALKEIAKFRTEINLFLDKAEDDVKTEVNRLKSEDEDLLIKLEEECKLLSTKTDAVKQAMSTELYQGQSLFIRSIECKPDILDTERAIAQLQSRNSIKKFKFVRDKKLSNIVATKRKFGDLDISQNGLVIKKAKDSELMSYARVRPYDNCKRGKANYHCWKPGTVINVNKDGDVTVEWDHSGQILDGFRFGYSDEDNGVELI